MKNIFYLFSFLIITSCHSRLNGYNLLKTAKDEITMNQNQKALKTLKKVEKANFGFCGNAYASGLGEAIILESIIYRSDNNYLKALYVLDSSFNCALGANCAARDSLKVLNLFSIYGKDNVVKSFKSNKIEKDTSSYNIVYKINLKEIDYKFNFYNSSEFFDDNYIPIDPSNIDSLNIILENQPFYQLIK